MSDKKLTAVEQIKEIELLINAIKGPPSYAKARAIVELGMLELRVKELEEHYIKTKESDK